MSEYPPVTSLQPGPQLLACPVNTLVNRRLLPRCSNCNGAAIGLTTPMTRRLKQRMWERTSMRRK